MRSHMMGFELLERPQTEGLSARIHALVRGLVTNMNRSTYSPVTTRSLANKVGEGKRLDSLIVEWNTDSLSDPDRVILEFAMKATRSTYKITEKDAQAFRDNGLNDEVYVDVLNTVAIQTSHDRLANCLGISADSLPILASQEAAQ